MWHRPLLPPSRPTRDRLEVDQLPILLPLWLPLPQYWIASAYKARTFTNNVGVPAAPSPRPGQSDDGTGHRSDTINVLKFKEVSCQLS